MSMIGTVESVWRYPVKSMRGEELAEAFLGFGGVFGDRWYAFCSSKAPKGFPFLTAREQAKMLLYRPAYRHGGAITRPGNLAEAEALPPGVTPVYPNVGEQMLDVETPEGAKLAVDDPALLESLREGIREQRELKLIRSDRAMTDCRPISLFSMQTARQLGEETGVEMDKRRFRANVYLDLGAKSGFSENEFAGRKLQIGGKTVVVVTDLDPRCKMITLDPDTAQANPEVMKRVARSHDGKAGVYGAVLVEGTIRPGDAVTVCD